MNLELHEGDRIVVKIGSSFLTAKSNKLDIRQQMKLLAEQVNDLKKKYKVVLVSSGAIACCMQELNQAQRPDAIVASSTTAAVGQVVLMHNYKECFSEKNLKVAQILLTADDLDDRGRYLNARNTILHLLELDIIPIVNENDVVATDEIKFGDNDKLSAKVASLIDANLLIILSDVDGVYDEQRQVIALIKEIDASIAKLARGTSRQTSVGGMITKFEAAKIAMKSGIRMVIANGSRPNILSEITGDLEIGTVFMPKENKLSEKKRWIAFGRKCRGKIIIDDGARDAVITKGKSLLSIGIVSMEGNFSFGDLVAVYDKKKREIGSGLTNYSSQELEKIKGKKTAKIESILGHKYYDEVIHRDNLVIF